jgi:hypothetical protein
MSTTHPTSPGATPPHRSGEPAVDRPTSVGTHANPDRPRVQVPTTPEDRAPLKNLTVRQLLRQLTLVEDELRSTPFWVDPDGNRRVNPDVAQLLARQRAIAEQLRARRVSWASTDRDRQQSAAWPRPPWT